MNLDEFFLKEIEDMVDIIAEKLDYLDKINKSIEMLNNVVKVRDERLTRNL